MKTATAIAHPNIALVKYWGKRDTALNLPAVPSISLTLDGFRTRTQVIWGVEEDAVHHDGQPAAAAFAKRVTDFLDIIDPNRPPCMVLTENNFPVGAGLASSASGFAALAVAATRAAGRTDDRTALSALARQGSGSACRSLFGGFVEWKLGNRPDGSDSHATPIASRDYWAVAMVVAVVNEGPKAVGSTDGMEASRHTSPYYKGWVDSAPADVEAAKDAIYDRDLDALGRVMEHSTLKMHACMMAANPPLLYWMPATLALMAEVRELRASGISAWATMDAGPQVKVLCRRKDADRVREALTPHARSVHVLRPGAGARLDEEE
ncbi:MAG: diphosphomevalonate decarboxylase [Myxococcales bacterium]|nr:diphosphomevalonate decarboxylase [Myxococcales bacterium]